MQIKGNSLKKKIHDEIMDGINKGQFPLDQFLNEGVLTERFNVSKAPIREALIELCNEKILRSIPRIGYQIIQLTERNVKEATELRLLLEIMGLKKAAPLINESALNSISSLNRECEVQMSKNTFTIEQHWEYNIRFHLMLNSFAGNSHINEVLSDTLKLIRRAYVQLYSDTDHDAYISMDLNRHIEVEKAIRDKDFLKAQELLKNDILFIRGKLFILSEDIYYDL